MKAKEVREINAILFINRINLMREKLSLLKFEKEYMLRNYTLEQLKFEAEDLYPKYKKLINT